MNNKIFFILLNYVLLFTNSNSFDFSQFEYIYRNYDSSFYNSNFYIREVEALKYRTDFLVGVDCSMVSIIEEKGGKYYDFDYKEVDFYKLLKANGVNLVRSRLWHNPYSASGINGGGYNDRDRVLSMALRAKNAGLKFLLDFHYSDNWVDPSIQTCPSAWESLSFDEAASALYTYTQETIEYFIKNGATIDYVQIGNEINNGFMFPFGKIDMSSTSTKTSGLNTVAYLLNIAINAVKSLSPSTKIILHTGDDSLKTRYENGKNVPIGLWFFEEMNSRWVNYDIAAVSFYLFYHHTSGDYLDMNTITDSINQFSESLGKQFMIMEYSTAYTLNTHYYANNQFGETQKYLIESEYPVSFQGQVNFIIDLAEKVAWANNNMGIGVCYWGGDWLPIEGAGWSDYWSKSSWSNQALFTYDGLATPALAAMNVLNPNYS